MSTLYLCGAGNSEGVRLALVLNRHAHRWDHIALLDDDAAKLDHTILGVRVVGPFSHLAQCDPKTTEVANLVARTTVGRRAARDRIAAFQIPFSPLIDPTVNTEGVTHDRDATVYQNATVGPESSIATGSVVFMGAVVGHESEVGECSVIAANAVLNARVKLGQEVYVGANASVLPEIDVGDGATIGAGSMVIQDVPPGATVVGVPGQVLQLSSTVQNRVGDLPSQAQLDLPSQGQLESMVRDIWEEILACPVGLEDNFFDLGGRSLDALIAQERVETLLGRRFAATSFFEYPTVKALAQFLAGEAPEFTDDVTLRVNARRAAVQKRRMKALP